MLKQETSSTTTTDGGGTNNNWARVCDTCHAAACTVYCQADAAYLCASCDARIHAANKVASRHQRVWMCEACERAPAAFLCKADAAALCTDCDADIHSANPLARRHQRVPILPLQAGSLYGPPTGGDEMIEEDEEVASWLLLNHGKSGHNNNNQQSNNNGFLFGGELDEYLDLMEYNNNNSCIDNQFNTDSCNQFQQQQQQHDSVVPVAKAQLQQPSFELGMQYDHSSKAAYNYNSISHSHSVTSMDIGIVPDTSIRDLSLAHQMKPNGTNDLFAGPQIPMPPQFTPMDREARVLRYREKKKTRKFEKTIRYASRKAYAETRPRIKGRFAKRTNVVELEMDQIFSMAPEIAYGIVPSF
ncbi:hypothetical protein ACFE04_010997 [Oxalis oulophora]